jgi:hypothetical protein
MKLVRSVPLVRKRTRRSKFSLLYNAAFLSLIINIIYYCSKGKKTHFTPSNQGVKLLIILGVPKFAEQLNEVMSIHVRK